MIMIKSKIKIKIGDRTKLSNTALASRRAFVIKKGE